MRDHGSIGIFREWCFCEEFGSECLGFFLFCFCLVRGEKAIDAQDFWLTIKGREPLQVVVSFLSLFGGNNSVLFIYLSGPKTFLHICFVFFGFFLSRIFFLFCFLPIFDWEFSSFALSQSLIGNLFFFLLRARMGILTLGQGLR